MVRFLPRESKTLARAIFYAIVLAKYSFSCIIIIKLSVPLAARGVFSFTKVIVSKLEIEGGARREICNLGTEVTKFWGARRLRIYFFTFLLSLSSLIYGIS
jgi:hypothetical protein